MKRFHHSAMPGLLGTLESRGEISDAEYLVASSPDNHVPVSVSASPLTQQGEVIGYIVTLRDITHRKQVEETRNTADRIMRHDLRNALTGVMGYAELMCKAENMSPVQHKALLCILKIGETMMNQIESYLSLQQMESGTFEPNPTEVNLMAVTRDVVQSLNTIASSKRVAIDLRLNGRPALPESVLHWRTEVPLFFGMLSNLIKNALEASPEDETVTISLDNTRDLSIRIHNLGTVPAAIQPHFFSKFVSSGKRRGTGLGAYSARLIAESLGGTIEFETDHVNGTTLTVRFLEQEHSVRRASSPI
jgi:signal transduction histidine kinase